MAADDDDSWREARALPAACKDEPSSRKVTWPWEALVLLLFVGVSNGSTAE